MKKFTKFMSLALVIIMMLALVIPAFADETDSAGDVTSEEETTAPDAGIGEGEDAVKGSITINDAVVNETVSIYRVLVLESFNTGISAYSYSAADEWVDFFKSNPAALDIFSFTEVADGGNYVTKKIDAPSATQLQTFASAALKYAKDNDIAANSAAVATTKNVVFDELDLGYYIVSSTLGTVCSITTTAPNATVKLKNPTSTLNKTVNDYNLNIGDTVTFTLSIEVRPDTDAQSSFTNAFINNFYIHDEMDSTLDFDSKSLKVVVKSKTGVAITDPTKFTIMTGEDVKDDCIFDIDFEDNYLKSGDTITVTYNATLNSTAVIGPEGNRNEARITYGSKQKVTNDVKVYTTAVYVYKHDANNNKPLPGAQFILRKTVGEGEAAHFEYYQATSFDEDKNVAKVEWTTVKEDATIVTTDAEGNAAFVGIEAGDYELEEIKAPDGYNKLTEPVSVHIEDSLDRDGYAVEDSFDPDTEDVANSKGSLLPATGGMGTTLFITLGAIVVISTGVVIVSRRRMALLNDED